MSDTFNDITQFLCSACSKLIRHENLIKCDGQCHLVFHNKCVHVKKSLLNELNSVSQLKWFCEICSKIEDIFYEKFNGILEQKFNQFESKLKQTIINNNNNHIEVIKPEESEKNSNRRDDFQMKSVQIRLLRLSSTNGTGSKIRRSKSPNVEPNEVMSDAKPDTVPGLGFKDKEKALETIKNLEGRDPDYQRLAVKGLIGRAKRTLTLTKDKEKLQNINDAISTFENWVNNFEKNKLSKDNRAYLPLTSVQHLLPLIDKFKISDKQGEEFLKAYKQVKGEYKNLRTVSSGEDQPTWDIVRNTSLKELLVDIEKNNPDLWKDDLPTKEHMQLILWAYSPDATKIKKNLATFEEKLGSGAKSSSNSGSGSSDEEVVEKKPTKKRGSDGNDKEASNKRSKRK